MKKLILVLIIFVLFFPCISEAQSIFADFIWNHEADKTIFWVLEDPNGQTYNGTSDIALEQDTNIYLDNHMNQWLQEIYIMNTDANIPDWIDTHNGKTQQSYNQINNMSTMDFEAFKAAYIIWAKKVVKVLTKINPVLD